jgi:NADP-dependent 3-hydroxy acid dehydrogenase YdfG
LTEEHWAQSLQLKFMGYVRCLKHVLPIMQKQGRGRVVNLIGNDGVKPSYWEIAPGARRSAAPGPAPDTPRSKPHRLFDRAGVSPLGS